MADRFPLLVDEHVPRSLVQALQRRDWVVLRVVDLPELGQGSDDEQVFSYALDHGYIVLSSDERALWRPKRYREQGRFFPGMLCWPQRHRSRMTISEAVEAIEQVAQEDDPFAYGYRFI
ncbi:MAG TPA: DUF5615 family PIN-like protein [Thermoanaerobaculia bacterium]|nr:DUF5615 family PIN-like protein [Thermoanaerobaculia bacterium]